MSDNNIQAIQDAILEFAEELNLINVKKALPFMDQEIAKCPDSGRASGYHDHCVSIAWMIHELHMPVSNRDLDIMISAALCHVLPETLENYDIVKACDMAGLDGEIAVIVKLITRVDGMNEEQETAFYNNIMANKLAYMIRLVDRANLIEHLCNVAPQEAKSYIVETKKYIIPMCIYGKENYKEFYGGISILLEKMRSLIQIMDVLFARYDSEELALNDEILNLKEDNSRLRGMIASMEETC